MCQSRVVINWGLGGIAIKAGMQGEGERHQYVIGKTHALESTRKTETPQNVRTAIVGRWGTVDGCPTAEGRLRPRAAAGVRARSKQTDIGTELFVFVNWAGRGYRGLGEGEAVASGAPDGGRRGTKEVGERRGRRATSGGIGGRTSVSVRGRNARGLDRSLDGRCGGVRESGDGGSNGRGAIATLDWDWTGAGSRGIRVVIHAWYMDQGGQRVGNERAICGAEGRGKR